MLKLLTYSFLIYIVFTLSKSFASSSEAKQVTLVFAANMPDIAVRDGGYYSQLASLLKQVRNKQKHTLFIFGGGSLGPSPMSSFDRGSHIIDILNTLEPDVMTIRKREFSYFEDELSLRSYEAAFPLVISNLYDPAVKGNLEGLYKSALILKGDDKIGVISLLEEEVVEQYLLQRVSIFEPKKEIEKLSADLREQGADVIMMVYSKKRPYYSELLDSKKIDIALRARSDRDNSELNNFVHPKAFSASKDDRAIILTLTWKESAILDLKITSEEILLSTYSEDPTVALQIRKYNERLNRLLDQRIGDVKVEMNSLRQSVRAEENAFANFIADTMKAYAQSDIGFINGGVIRGDREYLTNTVLTRRDITQELPFRSRVTLVTITGRQLKQALEHGISGIEQVEGRFPHVSGLKYTYSSSAKPGNRIVDVLVDGTPLDMNKKYSVATSDYIANGGDGYTSFLKTNDAEQNNKVLPLISDLVIRTIQKQHSINPQLDSRIVRVD